MKKAVYSLILIAIAVTSLMSCKKRFHCNCSYNNKVVYSTDLGIRDENDAKAKCSVYDTTVTGEVWNCTVY
jgi:hypothetical protein